MTDGDIQKISEITTEKGAFGTRYVVVVDGKKNKHRTVEKANGFRDEMLALQQEQRERRVLEQEAAEQEAVEAQARAEYDRDPEYFAMEIRPPVEVSTLVRAKNKEAGAEVDVEEYTRQINNACYKLWGRGYEVVSITPLISGSADLLIDSESGAGWGYSYTEGVVVLARKIREANAAE